MSIWYFLTVERWFDVVCWYFSCSSRERAVSGFYSDESYFKSLADRSCGSSASSSQCYKKLAFLEECLLCWITGKVMSIF